MRRNIAHFTDDDREEEEEVPVVKDTVTMETCMQQLFSSDVPIGYAPVHPTPDRQTEQIGETPDTDDQEEQIGETDENDDVEECTCTCDCDAVKLDLEGPIGGLGLDGYPGRMVVVQLSVILSSALIGTIYLFMGTYTYPW
jgi:hypothetical protein